MVKSEKDTGYQKLAADRIETIKNELRRISMTIHSQPEVAYQEFKASTLLQSYLADQNFFIENNLGGLETAFRASFGNNKGPTVAFLAEYDALPMLGHGCGHNLISAAAVGAAMGVAEVLKTSGLGGKVEVIGTPAEECIEGTVGKEVLLRRGVFDTVDVCLMFHPWMRTLALKNDLGFATMEVTFRGKEAHAGADPWNGKNALDGVVLTYNGLSMMRQQMRNEGRIHMIITEGGNAVNVIPDQAKAKIMFRALEMTYLDELENKIQGCIRGAATASQTEVVIETSTKIFNAKFNRTLFEIASTNLKQFGISLEIPGLFPASSDFGNVSQRIPSFCLLMKTHPEGIPWHSVEARDGAILTEAHAGMLMAAKILAMMAIDLFLEPNLLEEVKRAFDGLESP